MVKRRSDAALVAERSFWKNAYRSRYLYLMIALPVVYFIIFKYIPMAGISIAFQDYKIYKGFLDSKWVGLKHFEKYLASPDFWVLVRNTVQLSFWNIVVCFPVPVIFALFVNEIESKRYKGLVQNISYIPHFISVVVVVSILTLFVSKNGPINDLIAWFGGERHSFMMEKEWFRPLYILTELWKDTGWNAIIYLAALAGVDVQLYESARMDGANKFQQLLHITLPGITNTIVVMFILRMGSVLNIAFEKVLLMQNPVTYDTSDVISTFVYRRGLSGMQFSYASAVELFSSVINLVLLFITNTLSRRFGETSLW